MISLSPVQIEAEGSIPVPAEPTGIFLFRIEVDGEGGRSGIDLLPVWISMHAIASVADEQANPVLPPLPDPALDPTNSKIAP